MCIDDRDRICNLDQRTRITSSTRRCPCSESDGFSRDPFYSTETETTPEVTVEIVDAEEAGIDTSIRWFDGKAVRPTKVMYMTVTGYSPDARSCGIYADNKTATMNSVWTNGMNLVAADPKLLPYWSMISIPGYANSEIVPVLDCGGAIKGNRLDLLYPTHEIALQWGVRELPITIWEYVETE